jgi:hypothetical protein
MADAPSFPLPSEPAPAPDDLPLLDPSDLRGNHTIRVDIGGRAVIARKVDLTALVFEGAVPMPLLNAVQHLTSGLDGFASMNATDRSSMVQMFRNHACRVVIQPVITATDDEDPTHLPVSLLDMTALMRIWEATTTASVLSATAALRFRPTPSPLPVPAAHDGEDVRSPAEHVDPEPAGPPDSQPQIDLQYA